MPHLRERIHRALIITHHLPVPILALTAIQPITLHMLHQVLVITIRHQAVLTQPLPVVIPTQVLIPPQAEAPAILTHHLTQHLHIHKADILTHKQVINIQHRLIRNQAMIILREGTLIHNQDMIIPKEDTNIQHRHIHKADTAHMVSLPLILDKY